MNNMCRLFRFKKLQYISKNQRNIGFGGKFVLVTQKHLLV